MKKLIAALLLAVMCTGLFIPALAEMPAYDATKSFIAVLDEENLVYTFKGKSENGDEHILLENENENFAYEINVFFDEDNDCASVYVWYIIEFADADYADILYAVNELNYSYKYVRFYVDESDNTVTCAMNIILQDTGDAGDIVLEGLLRMASILKVAYPALKPYDVN